jgi:hypothetical protein
VSLQIVLHDLVRRHIRDERIENEGDPNAMPSDAGLSAADVWIDRNGLQEFVSCCVGCATSSRRGALGAGFESGKSGASLSRGCGSCARSRARAHAEPFDAIELDLSVLRADVDLGPT